ncbi:MAG: large conductance mechanosensitive channel protein MscL [Rhodospirillales bacterium]|nr:large conductance mechanosensitive channel protein MscL [Rhodospirillales bacterium]
MKMLQEFKSFALRGNLVDLTIGFTVGAAFTTIAKSLVSDILMPPIGLLLGRSDFSDLFLTLKDGQTPPPYNTLADAQEAGAVTINFGLFINNVLAFVLVAAVMFLLIRLINRAEAAMEARIEKPAQDEEAMQKKCPFCRSTIAAKATRCAYCTSQLDTKSDSAGLLAE